MQNIKYNEYHIRSLLLRDDIDFNKFTKLELIDFLNVSIKDNEMNKKQLKSKKEIIEKLKIYIEKWSRYYGLSMSTELSIHFDNILKLLEDKEV